MTYSEMLRKWRWWAALLIYMPVVLPFGLLQHVIHCVGSWLVYSGEGVIDFSEWLDDLLTWLFNPDEVKKWWHSDGQNRKTENAE